MIKNRAIKVLLFGGSLWYLGEGMLGPLFAVFVKEIGGDILEISWAYATYLIISGVLYVVIGRISDIYKNKELLMVIGYALNTIFTFAYIFVSSPWQLFIVQAGLGIALAFANPTWASLFAKHENKKDDGLEWGLAGGMGQVLTGVAIIIGGYIVSIASFNLLFIVMGTIQFIATVYQMQILQKKYRT